MKIQEKGADYLVRSQAAEWQRGTLGELLPIKYGKSLPEKLRDTTGSHPVFGSSGRVGIHSAALTVGPTLIIGRKGNVGAIHYSSEACWPIDTVYYVEPPEGQKLRYYKYLLESLNLVKLDKSTAVPGLSRDDYNAVEVVVAPPDQQDGIVAEIEKQFSRLDEAIANLKRYKAAVLKAAVEGRLVETEAELARREGRSYETGAQLLQRILESRRSQWQGKGKYKEPTAPDTTSLPELPEGWVWATTEQLGQIQLGRQRSPKNRSKDNPVKYIRAANITERGLELKDVLDMEFSSDEQERYRLRRGDLVLSEASGSPDQVGKPAVWQDQLSLCCFQNTVIRLRPAVEMSAYLLLCFQSYYVNGVFAKVAGGVGINHLSADKFSRLHISLPPEVEQHRIVAEVDRRLSLLRETEAQVDVNLQRAERLRQSILSRAFAGSLV